MRRSAALIAGIIAGLVPSAAWPAKMVQQGVCTIQVPDPWTVAGNSASESDGAVKASVTSVVDGASAIAVEIKMGGTLSENKDSRAVIIMNAPSGARRVVVVFPAAPGKACMAQATSVDAGHAGLAEGVARSLTQ